MNDKVIGFLGMGSMGFPMCHGLHKSGFQVIVPAYRKEEDCKTGYSQIAPDHDSKLALIDQMISEGAKAAASQAELVSEADVICISMPTSRQVEFLVRSAEGILNNAKPGTLVIDLTTADPASTRALAKELEAKGVDLLDAPVSGGTKGSIAQTLTLMVGGKKEVFERALPILNTLGDPDHVFYMGPSGAGNVIKVANNCMMAVNVASATEAICTAVKAGVDLDKALEVINCSGGRTLVSTDRFPNVIQPGQKFNFTLAMIRKDVALFEQIAKDLRISAPVCAAAFQEWCIPTTEGDDSGLDMLEFVKMYEKWLGVKVVGTK